MKLLDIRKFASVDHFIEILQLISMHLHALKIHKANLWKDMLQTSEEENNFIVHASPRIQSLFHFLAAFTTRTRPEINEIRTVRTDLKCENKLTRTTDGCGFRLC